MKLIAINITFLAIIICFPDYSNAQNAVDKTIKTVEKTAENLDATAEKLATTYRNSDTAYIEYYDEFSIHLYSVMYHNTFSLNDYETNSSVNYKPVRSPSLGIGISKYGFTLNLSNDFKIIKQSEEKYGETKKFDIKLSFIYKKMWFSGFYSRYKGYYIDNSKDYNFQLTDGKRPQRDDIKTYGYNISYMHVFSSQKFSLNSAYSLTQKQVKSAGSFLLGVGFGGTSIKGDSSLIPNSVKNKFDPHLDSHEIFQQLYMISGGYSYNLVFLKHLNFNITTTLGAAVSSSDLKTDDPRYQTNNHFDFSPNIAIMSALSYVRARFYSGMNVKINNSLAETGNKTGIKTIFMSGQIVAGYRLGTRNKRKK